MIRRTPCRFLAVLVVVAALIHQAAGAAQKSEERRPVWTGAVVDVVADEVLVKFKPGAAARALSRMAAEAGIQVVESRKFKVIDWHLLKVKGPLSLAETAQALASQPDVLRVEPNYRVQAFQTFPNDPSFPSLWGMHNTGQTGGVEDCDIDAPEAWDTRTGAPSVIVGVIDTGIDYGHEDLAGNMWVNQLEAGGLPSEDDDGNGLVDDIYGYDYCNGDGDPMDDYGHGTHCAGTIGALGDNLTGVTGVCWEVQIMALKFLDSDGYGDTADAIDCIGYAMAMGADILSNSWGGGGYSEALRDAIQAAGDQDILFVVAAGNDYGNDNDANPVYPASFDCPNVIAVAATDHVDALAGFSNYGATYVDLAAPGVEILSTTPGNTYSSFDGTSMAAPHVSGACALVWAQYPDASSDEIKTRILAGTDYVAGLAGMCVSEGRLNLFRSMCENPLMIQTTSPLPDAFVGVPYSVTLQASGGTPPCDWEIQDGFRESDPGSVWIGNGTAQGWRADDASWLYEFPDGFSFNYYGTDYSAVYVCSNGYLDLASSAADWSNTTGELVANIRIAPLWDDLMTNGPAQPGEDIYITEMADCIVIRWVAETWLAGDPVNVEAQLYAWGTVRFNYGIGNSGLSPTIGLSGGGGQYTLSALSGTADIPDSVSRLYTFGSLLPDGLLLNGATGEIAGEPSQTGAFAFNVTCTDSGTTAEVVVDPQQAVTKRFQLSVLSGPVAIEHGVVEVGHEWTAVNLTEPFTDPVIVAGPATSAGCQAGVVRLRNVTPTSFDICFQEWDYLDGWHMPERIHWMALERGVHVLSGGGKLIAEKFSTSTWNVLAPQWVAFPECFDSAPVVLAQVQTYSGADAVTDRICGVQSDGFYFSMQEQESGGWHCAETVGYVAVTEGAGEMFGVGCDVRCTGSVVTHKPFILVGSEGQAVVRVQEEQSLDEETQHWAGEQVGFICLGGEPPVVADMQTCNGSDACSLRCTLLSQSLQWEDGVAEIDHQWRTVSLLGIYEDPVVLAGPATYTGVHPGVVRVRSVTPSSFEIRFQEWDYLDGWHCQEQVHWMVAERGVWDVGGGEIWILDEFPMSNANVFSPTSVSLPLELAESYLVIGTQQTAAGQAAVTERLSSIEPGGFSVALQEQEAADAVHVEETLGYMVWGSGTGGLPAGAPAASGVVAGRGGAPKLSSVKPMETWDIYWVEEQSLDEETWHCAEDWAYIDFGYYPGQPFFILDMQTCNGTDPCTVRTELAEEEESSQSAPAALEELGLAGSGWCSLLVRVTDECGSEITGADVAITGGGPGSAVTERAPVVRVFKRGDVVTVSAASSISGGERVLAFSGWELDGEPAEPGLSAIEVRMTADREAVALYAPAP